MLACLLVLGCGDSEPPPPPILDEPSALPEALSELEGTFYEGIRYGVSEQRNLLDILLPKDRPVSGLLLYFHGGGFTGGSRKAIWAPGWVERLERILDAGVAVATADYRFLNRAEGFGVLRPLQDGARALQFLRYHHRELGLDPDQVVLAGASAGAGMSHWIGVNDDMADPASEDPVLRQSTRVRGVLLFETQASYDVARWSTDVFPDLGIGVLEGAALLGLEGRLLGFYGISELEEFESPETRAYRRSVDMLELTTPDDPPIFVRNKNQPNQPPLSVNILFHHANHAVVIAERAREVGVEVVLYAPKLGIEDPSGIGEVDFGLGLLSR